MGSMVFVAMRHRDEGAIAILVAVLATVLFGFGALVVDLGMARTIRQQAQDSADAAALAGADALYEVSSSPNYRRALQAVRRSARANFGVFIGAGCRATVEDAAGVVWDGGRRSSTTCIQFGRVSGEASTQVFVAMPPRHVDAAFGGLFGYSGIDVRGQAVAGTITTSIALCGLCVFDTVTAQSGARILVHGGGSFSAVDGQLADEPGIVTVTDGGKITFDPPTPSPTSPTPPITSSAYNPGPAIAPWAMVDPLLNRPTPGTGSDTFPVTPCTDATKRLSPGTYDGLDITGDCVLRRGVFVVTGPINVAPGASLTGTGATLVLTGSASLDNQGTLLLGGTASGFSIYSESTYPLVLGGSSITLGADVYARSNSVDISAAQVDVDGTMVTGALDLSPSSVLSVTAGGAPVVLHGELGLVQ